MPERLIEIVVSSDDADRVCAIVQEGGYRCFGDPSDCNPVRFQVLVQASQVEGFIEATAPVFGRSDTSRMVVLPVEASYPRDDQGVGLEGEITPASVSRISRDELYADINEFADTNWTFVTMTVLSSIVAAVGFSRNSPAIIIGAMVIAPLLGPNMALALGTTLGDARLTVRALKTNLVGVSIAAVTGALSGLIWPLDIVHNEIATRTSSSFGEIALALTTGVAGALAVTSGLASSLVGVMVAVALLPPIIIASMLAVQGSVSDAGGAVLLVAINVICLNLASVVTFRLKGIKPSVWWEAEQAKRSTKIAMMIWIVLLGVVATLVALSKLAH